MTHRTVEEKKENLDKFYNLLADCLQSLPHDSAALILPAMVLLGEGNPLTPDRLAEAQGISEEEGREFFSLLKEQGFGEFDKQGRLVGLGGLSVTPTRHRLQVGNRTLYGWCALDTLYLPAYLKQSAEVVSQCPVSKQAIRLSVTPVGVAKADPPDVFLSLVGPGFGLEEGCCSDKTSFVGTGGSLCGHIHFLASREAAETWLVRNPRVQILSLKEADDFAGRLRDILFDSEQKKKISGGGCNDCSIE